MLTKKMWKWFVKKIQRLDPLGIASTDLQDCLQIQLGHSDTDMPEKNWL